VVVQTAQLEQRRLRGFELDVVPDELELINRIVDIIVDLDPDIIVGWEVQTGSWGYLNARGRSYGLLMLLFRALDVLTVEVQVLMLPT
jgi:DNA polymerase zeta